MKSNCCNNHDSGDRQSALTPDMQPLFVNAIDPMLVLDDQGECITSNASAREFLGLQERDLQSRTIDHIFAIDGDVLAHWRAHLNRHRHESQPLESSTDQAINHQAIQAINHQAIGVGHWQIYLTTPSSETQQREIECRIIANIGANQHLFIWRDVTERNAADRQRQAIFRALQPEGYPQPAENQESLGRGDELAKSVTVVWPPSLERLIGLQPGQFDGTIETVDVTAEKRQQELLRHYERIVSATPDAIALIDRHYRYLVVNQAYSTRHALTEQELIGAHVAEAFGHEIFQSRLKPRLDKALAGNIVRFQDWFEFRGVGTQFISITYAPYFEENGSVMGVVVVVRDITGLKQAEITFHCQAEQEHLLAGITNRIRQTFNLQSILDITVAEVQSYLGADRVFVYEFDENWSGVVIAEAVAEGYPSFWGRIITDQCFTTEQCMAAYAHGRIQNVADIHAAQLPDCYVEMLSQFSVRANLVMPILQNQHVWGLLVAQHCAQPRAWRQDEIDLLEQLTHQMAIAIQQAELYKQVYDLNVNLEAQVRDRTADLEQSLAFESLLKRITVHVRDSLEEHYIFERVVRELAEGLDAYSCDTSVYDLEKRVSYIQHEYIRSTIPEAHGNTVQMDDFEQIYAQLLEGKSLQFCWLPAKNDVRIIDGKVMCFTCPMIDDQGVLGDIWIYRSGDRPFDDAEIHLLEQVANQCAIALRQARLYESAQAQVTELERLNRLKDDFLSTVSHELRTPMSNIKMALQMFELYLGKTQLLEDDELPLGHYFQILKDECDREIDLINNLLDLTRLDSDIEPLTEQSMSLSMWVQHIAEVFVERAHCQQQELTIDIPEHLMIHTDLTYLERVLVELLNNACKYTPPGEQIRVLVRPLPEENASGESAEPSQGDSIQLIVSNSGIELPPAECDRIFERFYRIPNNDPWKHGGTGLGLALVQKLVHKLGATICAESDNNEVRFVLTLPLNQMFESSAPAIGSDAKAELDS